MVKDGSPDIAEVLERIRIRLRTKIEADLHTREGAVPAAESLSVNIDTLHHPLAAIRSAHQRVGVVNPRHPGLINSLIQTFKKSIRRILSWYTRPIVEFQDHTIQFLSETAGILSREQSRLASLEKTIGGLAAELADLRQQFRSRLDCISSDVDDIKRDNEQMRIDQQAAASSVEGSRGR